MAAPRGEENRAEKASPKSDDAQVVEALRALVRHELGRPKEEPHHAPEPSLKEGVSLLLFCLNTVLLVSRLPRELLSDPAMEAAGKLLPALFGSLFVIYLAWFRERMLALTRHRRFNQSQAGLLLVLAFTAVPLFPIRPDILPKGTGLSVDGKPHKNPRTLWLSLGAHDVLLQPARDAGAEPRQFRFGVSHLLRALWFGGQAPDWSLLYPVGFKARDLAAKVQVRKIRGVYYDDIFEGNDLDRRGDAAFVLFMDQNRMRTVPLPLGNYELQWTLGSGKTCRPYPLEVKGADDLTSLEDQPCSGN